MFFRVFCGFLQKKVVWDSKNGRTGPPMHSVQTNTFGSSTNIDEHRRTGPCHKGNPRRTTTNIDEQKIFSPPRRTSTNILFVCTLCLWGGVGAIKCCIILSTNDIFSIFFLKRVSKCFRPENVVHTPQKTTCAPFFHHFVHLRNFFSHFLKKSQKLGTPRYLSVPIF